MTDNSTVNNNGKSVTHQLLARAHSPDSVNRIYADKIQYRPLLLRPNSPPPQADAREARRRARQRRQQRAKALKPKPLSSRRRRALGLHGAAPAAAAAAAATPPVSYAVLEPLNRMWQAYVREILGAELYTGGPAAAAKLSAAEFSGARVRVSRSSCPSRVGIAGIVARDTRFTFEIVTPDNAVKTVPKEGTMFRVEVSAAAAAAPGPAAPPGAALAGGGSGNGDQEATKKPFSFEIHGDQFQHRSADRANKKFKAHYLDKL